MSYIKQFDADSFELDIPGDTPEQTKLIGTMDQAAPVSRIVDKVFAVIVTFIPPLAFILALYLHFTGWYTISFVEICIMCLMWFLALTGVEVGFHRLFAHGSYKAHRVVRYVLAALGSMAFQGPVIWWASIHRKHHRHSDKPNDPHSMYLYGEGFWALFRGFFHAHVGWVWKGSSTRSTGWSRYVWDLYRDKDIFKIHMHYFYWLSAGFMIPAIIGGLIYGSWKGAFLGFLWGGFVRVFIMNHITYWCINTLSHSRLGTRPFKTADHSSNVHLWALFTMGQTLHNNHHAFPSSSRMGYRWYEIDIGTWILKLLEKFGLVWRLKQPSLQSMEKKRKKQ